MTETELDTDFSEQAAVDMGSATGDPDTGYYVRTPERPLRKWPRWTLRAHMPEGGPLAHRFDFGGPITDSTAEQYMRFVAETHIEVVPGVWVLKVVKHGFIFYPDVISVVRKQGRVSRWLDSLPCDRPIGFPEVVNLQFAEMLHRRGFQLRAMWDDDAAKDDWIPVHVRLPKKETSSDEANS